MPPADPGAIRVTGQLLDGDDRADRRRDDRSVGRGRPPLGPKRHGRRGRVFLRDREAGRAGREAPRLDLHVFARGLLKHQLTRMYFPDEPEANASDPVLSLLPEADRALLVAEQEDGAVRFDIRMQGERQTVFFSL